MRTSPNIIVTGTPGVGKTTHCEELARRTGLKHLSVNQVVKDRECHEGWDDEFQSWIVDEDKLLDAIEGDVQEGATSLTGTPATYSPKVGLTSKYPEAKLQENLDSEIMEVLLQEAREAFDEEIVVELTSNTSDEMETNISRVEAWLEQWKNDHSS
ncbi:hypothetical protein BDP81DRAFT_413317 [Colletotrichum phormii]|uniref:Uncharacterized protein n=1 Tax=Colletotrichum phormii TaxID=359342 RepID=A0AAJ0ENS9_9PEZI|nr:uncharacterized protein BDP81DRAFT_413317 [Colletotrichum phormii]KAK1655758.1 hypothetical protein BDP81DRAFT_413317 [Colletotrichum phormii]